MVGAAYRDWFGPRASSLLVRPPRRSSQSVSPCQFLTCICGSRGRMYQTPGSGIYFDVGKTLICRTRYYGAPCLAPDPRNEHNVSLFKYHEVKKDNMEFFAHLGALGYDSVQYTHHFDAGAYHFEVGLDCLVTDRSSFINLTQRLVGETAQVVGINARRGRLGVCPGAALSALSSGWQGRETCACVTCLHFSKEYRKHLPHLNCGRDLHPLTPPNSSCMYADRYHKSDRDRALDSPANASTQGRKKEISGR